MHCLHCLRVLRGFGPCFTSIEVGSLGYSKVPKSFHEDPGPLARTSLGLPVVLKKGHARNTCINHCDTAAKVGLRCETRVPLGSLLTPDEAGRLQVAVLEDGEPPSEIFRTSDAKSFVSQIRHRSTRHLAQVLAHKVSAVIPLERWKELRMEVKNWRAADDLLQSLISRCIM